MAKYYKIPMIESDSKEKGIRKASSSYYNIQNEEGDYNVIEDKVLDSFEILDDDDSVYESRLETKTVEVPVPVPYTNFKDDLIETLSAIAQTANSFNERRDTKRIEK